MDDERTNETLELPPQELENEQNEHQGRTMVGVGPSQNLATGNTDNPPESAFATVITEPRSLSGSASSWADRRETRFSTRSDQPLPPLPENISPRSPLHPDPRSMPLNTRRISLTTGQPEVTWIVPRENRPFLKKTAGERLDPTLTTAIGEKEKYAFKARLTGFALNAAIGMQVVLGALTTGLSVVTTGHQTQIMTAVLGNVSLPTPHLPMHTLTTRHQGGIATIVASYLARARGSNEPELSITRVKDLEQFIRDCEAFKMDRGHVLDDAEDGTLVEFRRRFEDLLGNANGERKLSA